MSKPKALKKGDKVIPVHYKGKNRYPVTVTDVFESAHTASRFWRKGESKIEIWVSDKFHGSWWGPRHWFRKIK